MKDRRLYVFDIDGTLIASGGAGGSAMRAAFAALWGLEDGFRAIEFSGRTDRAILRSALQAAGLLDGAFDQSLQRFKRAYFRRLPATLARTKGKVLPGVHGLLETLAGDEQATVCLGTGNFRISAAMKLHHYGLASYFRFGGFGDHCEDRAVLIAYAIARAERERGRHATVFVIGDTPHDVQAARENGAIAVGVATGTASESQLAEAGADLVLNSLADGTHHLLSRG